LPSSSSSHKAKAFIIYWPISVVALQLFYSWEQKKNPIGKFEHDLLERVLSQKKKIKTINRNNIIEEEHNNTEAVYIVYCR
jgi:hypothetical protein